eukprot:scaffold421188_cov47-Attheya_sp.AAC.4
MKRPIVDSVDSFGRARGSAWGNDDVDDVRHTSVGQDPARCAEVRCSQSFTVNQIQLTLYNMNPENCTLLDIHAHD